MNLKDSAADHAASRLRTVFDQLEAGTINTDDVTAANTALELADVFGVTAQDYARRLGPS